MAKAQERALWEQIVAEVEAGLSRKAAARRHGVSQSGVGHWVKRLREEKSCRPVPQLLPVRLTTTSPSRGRCTLIVNELHLTFDEGTDPGYIATVARALRAC